MFEPRSGPHRPRPPLRASGSRFGVERFARSRSLVRLRPAAPASAYPCTEDHNLSADTKKRTPAVIKSSWCDRIRYLARPVVCGYTACGQCSRSQLGRGRVLRQFDYEWTLLPPNEAHSCRRERWNQIAGELFSEQPAGAEYHSICVQMRLRLIPQRLAAEVLTQFCIECITDGALIAVPGARDLVHGLRYRFVSSRTTSYAIWPEPGTQVVRGRPGMPFRRSDLSLPTVTDIRIGPWTPLESEAEIRADQA